MKSGGIVAVVAVLAVVVFLFLRGRQSDEVTVATRAGSDSGGVLRERRPGERSSSAPGSLREGRKRALPPGAATGAGASGGDTDGDDVGGTGGAASAARFGGEGRDGGPGSGAGGAADVAQARGPDVTRRDAPDAGSTGPVVDYDAEGNAKEPIPEVAFESADDRVFPSDSQEEVQDAGPIGGGSGTVSFWLMPEWGEGSQDDATFVQLGDSGLEITKNVNYLRFQYQDSAGVENGLGSNLSGWTPNEWRLVTATWAGGQLTLYVDGVMVSQNQYEHPPSFQEETKLYVGSSYPSGAPAAPASIASLKVFNRDWAPAEIVNQFRAGPPKR
jgi:hypothetical protein